MQEQLRGNSRNALLFAFAAASAAIVGLGFAGWLDSGARMFMTLAEAGLAWCF